MPDKKKKLSKAFENKYVIYVFNFTCVYIGEKEWGE